MHARGGALARRLGAALLVACLACALLPCAAGAVSSAQAIAWLNAQREANGIPAGITDNPEWDAGCQAHMRWWAENPNASNPHIETPGTPGYTTAGAFAGANAVLAQGSEWAVSTQYPWHAANPWEHAPIHLMQLLGAELSVTGFAPTCMITWAGYQRTPPATPQLLAYPGNGTSFIYASERAEEWPFTPAAFVGLQQGGLTGPYLYVLGWGTGRGRITAASLNGPGGPVEVRTVDDYTTGSLGELGSYLPPGGIVIPVKPLAPSTTYTASVTFAPTPTEIEAPPVQIALPEGGTATIPGGVEVESGPGTNVSPGESRTAPTPLSLSWTFTTARASDALSLWPATISPGGRVVLYVESAAPNVSVRVQRPHGRGETVRAHRRRGRLYAARAVLGRGRWRVCAASGGASTRYAPARTCISLRIG